MIKQGILRSQFIFHSLNIWAFAFCFSLLICWTGSTPKRTQFGSSLSQLFPRIKNRTVRYRVLEEWNFLLCLYVPSVREHYKLFVFTFLNVNIVSLRFYVSGFVDEGMHGPRLVRGSGKSFAAHCNFKTNSVAHTASSQVWIGSPSSGLGCREENLLISV